MPKIDDNERINRILHENEYNSLAEQMKKISLKPDKIKNQSPQISEEEITQYTIGIYFDKPLERVALILKNRPKWQAGLYNFPGGHIEKNETAFECVSREFKEECGISTTPQEWKYIGRILNKERYFVEVLSLVQKESHGELTTNEDQPVHWCSLSDMPQNLISNLTWLLPFALDAQYFNGNDSLIYGLFEYSDKPLSRLPHEQPVVKTDKLEVEVSKPVCEHENLTRCLGDFYECDNCGLKIKTQV